MAQETKYSKVIDDIAELSITTDNIATLAMDEMVETVQLANNTEANKLIAEFEDSDGELCWHDDSIMGKYASLHKFRP